MKQCFALMLILLTSGASQWTMKMSNTGPVGPAVTIEISPTTATVVSNGSQSFSATVTGTANTAVTWDAASGSISGSGLNVSFVAPTVSVQDTTTVMVTSVADPTKSATAMVTLTPSTPPPPPAGCNDPGVYCALTCAQSEVVRVRDLAAADTTMVLPNVPTVVLPECQNTDPADPNGEQNVWSTGLGLFTGTPARVINFIGQGIDHTVIIANLPVGASSLTFNNGNTDTTGFRVSAFTIQEETNVVGGAGTAIAMLNVISGSHAMRVDHVFFKNLGTHGQNPGVFGVGIGESTWGLVDNVIWTGTYGGQARLSHTRWGNNVGNTDPSIGNQGNSDRAWSDPSTMGTNQAMYFEDTVDLLAQSSGKSYGCNLGARCVYRKNWITQIGAHGTDSSGRVRGVRQWEVYENKFALPREPLPAPSGEGRVQNTIIFRGGMGVVWGNETLLPAQTIPLPANLSIGPTFTTQISQGFGDNAAGGAPQLQTYRLIGSRPSNFGACDGTGAFDRNDTTGGPNHDGIYDSGTIDSSSTTTLISDATKSWTPSPASPAVGGWTGYIARTATGCAVLKSRRIMSNTSNTLTTENASDGAMPAWTVGCTYEIRRAYDCIDSQGRGQSALLTSPNTSTGATCVAPGLIPGTSITNVGCAGGSTTTGWVQHRVEPVYVWQNFKTMRSGERRQYANPSLYSALPSGQYPAAVSSYFGGGAGNPINPLSPNRDWYEETVSPAFDGTVGMGVGPVAQRPATCTVNSRLNPDGTPGPGVGWWDPATRQLTVCSALNTWSLYYQPYVYPHPLQGVATMSANGHMIEDGAGHVMVHPKVAKRRR